MGLATNRVCGTLSSPALGLYGRTMQLLFDFFPIVVFFVVFKLYGIYAATASIMAAMAIQIAIQWFRTKTISKMQLISALLVGVFGGMTLVLRNPIFIQWKPTIVHGLFAIAFLGSQFIGEKTIIERLMGHAIELPKALWTQLNGIWIANFVVLGVANIYVVYNYDEATWVNFKLFGTLGLTLLTAVGQAVWIARNTPDEHPEKDG
jgi:intracellular septation protein